ncbi:MAG: hypothetical protein ACR2Q4_02065 [Geminicoccaceae bacterium]
MKAIPCLKANLGPDHVHPKGPFAPTVQAAYSNTSRRHAAFRHIALQVVRLGEGIASMTGVFQRVSADEFPAGVLPGDMAAAELPEITAEIFECFASLSNL